MAIFWISDIINYRIIPLFYDFVIFCIKTEHPMFKTPICLYSLNIYTKTVILICISEQKCRKVTNMASYMKMKIKRVGQLLL